MGTNRSEGHDIDLLIEGLSESPAPKAAPRPVNRWSNVRLLRPTMPAHGPGRAYASTAMSLPELPDFGQLLSRVISHVRLPGQVTMVRLWVGLGLAHCASMTAWPYPKTYLWPLVLYLLSLALGLVTGIWGARLSWDARLGAAHTVAIATVAWAVALAAAEILPLL